jgi:hypothetical protein
MRNREQELNLKAVSLINEYKPDSLVGLDYKNQIKPNFEVIQNLFYRSDESKWSIMKAYAFISENQISPDLFKSFLEELFTQRFSISYFQDGSKSAYDFIRRLEKSKRFKSKNEYKPRIKHLNSEEYQNFINDLRCFKQKYLQGISQNKWIDLISENFIMQNAPSTFRKDYHELRLKE